MARDVWGKKKKWKYVEGTVGVVVGGVEEE